MVNFIEFASFSTLSQPRQIGIQYTVSFIHLKTLNVNLPFKAAKENSVFKHIHFDVKLELYRVITFDTFYTICNYKFIVRCGFYLKTNTSYHRSKTKYWFNFTKTYKLTFGNMISITSSRVFNKEFE